MTTDTLTPVAPRPFRFQKDQFRRMRELDWFAGQHAELLMGEVFNQDSIGVNGDHSGLRRWSVAEFHQMAEWGWFGGINVLLLDGEILVMPVQSPQHFVAIDKSASQLRTAFGPGYWVRAQAPLEVDESTDAEPDIAVVQGDRNDYLTHHPNVALLVVEASATTLLFDRGRKGSAYARAKIADYWIINLVDRLLEVYRQPNPDPDDPLGHRYADVTILTPEQSITPLAAPNAVIRVSDLLP